MSEEKKQTKSQEIKEELKHVEEKTKDFFEDIEHKMIHARKEESDYILKDMKKNDETSDNSNKENK